MALRVAIDTNRYSDLVKGVPAVVEIVAAAEEVLVPLNVVAELRAGFAAGTKQAANEGMTQVRRRMRSLISLPLLAVLGSSVSAPAQPPTSIANPPAVPLCASSEQTTAVLDFYAKMEAMLPLLATRTLKMPEALIVSALKPDKALGADGKNFAAVWESARTWGDVVFFVSKGGNQFEINGTLPEGVQSTSSNYFNLGPQKAGITGHLRADNVVSIYAISLKQGKTHVRGLNFYDAKGDSQFSIFLPGEGAPVPKETEAAFDKTWALLSSLPRVCK